MEFSTASNAGDKSPHCKKKSNLIVCYTLDDFRELFRTGKETRFERRYLSFQETTIQFALDIDFTGENLNAQILYCTSALSYRSYETICTFSIDTKSGQRTPFNQEFHLENLWPTVIKEWRPLCSIPCILRKLDLYRLMQSNFDFLLIFEIVELEHVEVDATLKTLSSLFENDSFADFMIVAEAKEFKVHRAVLATASPVFEAMFVSQMKEQKESKVYIDDVEAGIIKEMLRFIYTGTVININEHATKLLIAADKYRLTNLKGFCGSQLSRSLDTENVMNILILADTYNDDTLKESAFKFINKNLKAILQKEENVELLESRPDFIVKMLLNIV